MTQSELVDLCREAINSKRYRRTGYNKSCIRFRLKYHIGEIDGCPNHFCPLTLAVHFKTGRMLRVSDVSNASAILGISDSDRRDIVNQTDSPWQNEGLVVDAFYGKND